MSDDLLDTTDIFKNKSLGNSPLNENIESLDKMEQIIAEFDENIREVKYNVHYTNHTQINETLFSSNISQDCASTQPSTALSSKISSDGSESMIEEQYQGQDQFINNQVQPIYNISQPQVNNVMNGQIQNNQQKEQNSFSIQDDVLGGMKLSYLDFSKQMFQQYKQENHMKTEDQKKTEADIIQPAKSQRVTFSLPETNQQEKIKENTINDIKEDCLQKGMGKIKELGDTIKSSITIMHEKFNEVKTCVSSLVEEEKYKDVWDDRLNEFYNKLFSQASKALFIPNITNISANTPSKILVQKPQSVYRFSTKTSVSKPITYPQTQQPMRKPGSVTKFNAPSMLSRPSSVLKNVAQQQMNKANEAANNGIGVANRQKSFTVQKFNLNKTPTTPSKNFGILKNSKDIQKESVKKITPQVSKVPLKSQSTNKSNMGKENITFFKK